MSLFVKKIINVDGIDSEIYQNTNLKTHEQFFHIVIIPGNPGIGGYYLNLSRSIWEKTKGQYGLSILSYAGFTEQNTNRVFSITEEAEHKIKLIKVIRQELPKNSKLILIGHSIGGWICLKILNSDLSAWVEKAILIFPFITQNLKSTKQTFTKFLIQKSWIRSIISEFFTLLISLPIQLKSNILAFVTNQYDTDSKNITYKYFGELSHIINSVLYMASTEFQELGIEMDLFLIQENVKKLHFIYTQDDHWASIEQAQYLKKQIQNINLQILDDVEHAFCVTGIGNKIISNRILEILLM
ncbi:MAG: hypothetical protein H7A23_23075 [Leptospiraceae bacterium]|nr:hypothetical protein [Leptospiraceae bacterium]MCP5497449.1 hypothetical protein [Leptospiraceae bacterium]